VLIVDDEPNILRAVSRTIARSHEVVTANDGDDALDLIRRDPRGFDAVMTDVQMPRMSGVELYRALEREFPALADRVLFMTGGVFAAEVEMFLRGLTRRVLRKPFDPDLLRRLVDERVALSRVA
jgi:CheY-like chemotaxis protein